MADLFDPADQEIGPELIVGNDTPESAYIADHTTDPEGTEARSVQADIHLPDWYFRKHALTDLGKPTYNKSVADGILKVFDTKFGTPMTFNGDNAESEETYFDSQVNQVVDGINVLLEVDPQSTGLNFLQLCTRTWSEFASVCYEYQDSMSSQAGNEDIPDWLIEREEKMVGLGRKARILSSALTAIDHAFGLKNTAIDRFRVQNAIKDRLQRLAEWNFNQHADSSGKVKKTLNVETNAHMKSIVDNA
jgi:hypothetical protein